MTNRVARGVELCCMLAKALKIERPVRSITLKAACSEAALVTVEFFPTPEESEQMAKIVEEYKIEDQPSFKGSWRDDPQL
jgi:hypothetical protein